MEACLDKNIVDKDEYPQTAEIEARCVHMLADLWHSPLSSNTIGCSTTGSSEAAMLAGLALKWRWRAQRQAMKQQARMQRQQVQWQRRSMRRGSLVGPLLIVALGIIFLLAQTGKVSWPRALDWFGTWWPLVLIGAGVLLVPS